MGSILMKELIEAMSLLARDERVIFIGQSICYPGHIMYNTLEHIEESRKIELPVAEDMQMGISIGLSLEGYIPVSIYPRMDFLIIAANQLVNHLDKIEEMSDGEFMPKVIIRTMIGCTSPFHPGPQHCQDHTKALQEMLTNIEVIKIIRKSDILSTYEYALENEKSTIIVETPELYN